MTRESQLIHLSPNEPAPLRYVRCLFNKKKVVQCLYEWLLCVIFSDGVKEAVCRKGGVLAAVARPRKEAVSCTRFDGKLGIWTFVERMGRAADQQESTSWNS